MDTSSSAVATPILSLYYKLDDDLRRDATGPNVKSLMENYLKNETDWKGYVNFNQFKYCRNLVMTNDLLELIVLCWLPNQVSPIHNHAGQRCWAAILDGNIQETHFHFQRTHSAFGEGPLEETSKQVFNQGQVSFISDDIALHVLQPINGSHGVTLHLYSKPIPECNIYCKETGTITKRKMGFYSIGKELQPQDPNLCCSTASASASISTTTSSSEILKQKENQSSCSSVGVSNILVSDISSVTDSK